MGNTGTSTRPELLESGAPDASTEPPQAKPQRANLLLAKVFLGLQSAFSAPQSLYAPRAGVVAESSTADREVDYRLCEEVRELFEQGATEFFQDGMSSRFSGRLLKLISLHGRETFRAIAAYLSSQQKVSPDVTSEALRWISEINDPSVRSQQWEILGRALTDKSPRVRDGAILGFANLDHPLAAQPLAEANKVEQVQELRSLIEQVLAQLERQR
jgi:hypothetical protein